MFIKRLSTKFKATTVNVIKINLKHYKRIYIYFFLNKRIIFHLNGFFKKVFLKLQIIIIIIIVVIIILIIILLIIITALIIKS
jgi:hypothetical protein